MAKGNNDKGRTGGSNSGKSNGNSPKPSTKETFIKGSTSDDKPKKPKK